MVEFPWGRAEFAALEDYEKVVAVAAQAQEEGSPADPAIARQGATEFSVPEGLAAAAPARAIIDAWGLLEYQLNVASDRIAPHGPHGWPQVAHTLETLSTWPVLYPVVLELRRLRDHTVEASRPPSSSDAARYVSVAQEVVTTLRTSLNSKSRDAQGGG